MATNIGFSNPQITINNNPVAIKPNSFKYKAGKGEVKVRATATGGGSSVSIHTVDTATRVSTFEFALAVTDDNRGNASTWKDNIGANTCLASQTGLKPVVGINMSLTNEPDFEASADGWVTVTFQGDPINEV